MPNAASLNLLRKLRLALVRYMPVAGSRRPGGYIYYINGEFWGRKRGKAGKRNLRNF